MGRKEYKRYGREFNLEAVRLAALGERPKAQIARELGIYYPQRVPLAIIRLGAHSVDRTTRGWP